MVMKILKSLLIILVVFFCSRQNNQNEIKKTKSSSVQKEGKFVEEFNAPKNWRGHIEFNDSIIYIHNPDEGLYEADSQYVIKLENDLVIEDKKNNLTQAHDVIADSKGNIYIFCQRDKFNNSIIKKYKPDGNFISDLNKQNNIKDLRENSFLGIDADDNLIVCEYIYRNFRFTLFDKNGNLITRKSVPFTNQILLDFHFHNNNYYLLTFDNKIMDIKFDKLFNIFKLSKDFKDNSTIYQRILKASLKLPIFSNSLTPFFKPFTNIKERWDINSNGYLFVADSEKYQIAVYNPNGVLAGKIDRSYGSFVKVTAEDKAIIYDSFFAPPYGSNISDNFKNKIIQEYKIPELKPAIQKIICDDKDWLWILTYETNKKDRCGIDIFDNNGVYLQRIWLESFPEYIRDNLAYSIVEDSVGNRVCKRFKILKNKL